MNVSMLLPLVNPTPMALNRLRFVLDRLEKARFKKEQIIIVQQHHSLGSSLKIPDDIKQRAICLDWLAYGNHVEYARMVILAADFIKDEYVWVHDPMTCIPFHRVASRAKETPEGSAIKTYGRCYYINEESTERFIAEGTTQTGEDEHYKAKGEVSYIFRKNEFLELYDKRIEDKESLWGIEQILDFSKLRIFSSVVAVRLFTEDYDIEYRCRINEEFESLIKTARALQPHQKRGRIVHVVSPNAMGDDSSMRRQKIAIESINRAVKETYDEVVRVLAYNKEHKDHLEKLGSINEWVKMPLDRDARSVGHSKDQPFLKDMFECGGKIAREHDFIFYTNSDIIVRPDIYNRIFEISDCYGEFYRHDIPESIDNLEDSLNFEGELLKRGIDGICLRKDFFDLCKDYLPDVMTGEPFWEPPMAGTLRKIRKPYQDKSRLIHPNHMRTWSVHQLNSGSQYNLQFLREHMVNGKSITNNSDIFFDDAILCVVQSVDKSFNYDGYRSLRNHIYRFEKDYTVIIVEIIESDKGDLSVYDVSMYPFTYLQVKKGASPPETADNIRRAVLDNCEFKRIAIPPVNFQFNEDTPGSIERAISDLEKKGSGVEVCNDASVATKEQFESIRGPELLCEAMVNLIEDVAVIMPFWLDKGKIDKSRTDAISYAFEELKKQNGRFKICVVEAVYDGSKLPEKILNDEDILYLPVRAYPESIGLFQKEALINIAVQSLPSQYEYLVFIDADVLATNRSFIMETRREMGKHKYAINQPGVHVMEIKHNKFNEAQARLLYSGLASIRDRMVPTYLQEMMPDHGFLGYHHFNPGICWAMTRSLFDEMGGLNIWGCLVGGGDSILLYEGIKSSRVHTLGTNGGWFKNVFREDVDAEVVHPLIKCDFVHVWHGDKETRPYHLWWYFFNKIDFDPQDCVQQTESGLLKWVFKPPLIEEFMNNKDALASESDVDRLIASYPDNILFIYPAARREEQNYIINSSVENLISIENTSSESHRAPVCVEITKRHALLSVICPTEPFKLVLGLTSDGQTIDLSPYRSLVFKLKPLYAENGNLSVSLGNESVDLMIDKPRDVTIPLSSFKTSEATDIFFEGQGDMDILLTDIRLLK